jgi:hypothetical protein
MACASIAVVIVIQTNRQFILLNALGSRRPRNHRRDSNWRLDRREYTDHVRSRRTASLTKEHS